MGMRELDISVTFCIVTLGCKVNQYESEKIRKALISHGLKEVLPTESPDIYIVNTCAVTSEAARKSRQMIRRGKRFSSRFVYAIGCASEIPEDALQGIEGVIFVRNSEKEDLPNRILDQLALKGVKPHIQPVAINKRTRAFLKVQDGCNNFCSYCIIPYLRGRSRSRPLDDVLEELKKIEKDHLEVVLTGIHLGDWGKDINSSLPHLVESVVESSNIPRIRLSSIEPMDFSFELLDLFKKYPRLCPHLHLPLQHASDKILKRMRRNYTLSEYDKIIKCALEVPKMSITTDVIVGFPGEDEEDFEILYNYIKNSPFLKIHVFPYSKRRGTIAERMDNHVSSSLKKERLKKLIELSKLKTAEILKTYIGKDAEVLVEEKDAKFYSGFTKNYIRVVFESSSGSNFLGRVVKINIKGVMEDKLYGENPQFVCNGR